MPSGFFRKQHWASLIVKLAAAALAIISRKAVEMIKLRMCLVMCEYEYNDFNANYIIFA